MHHVCTAKFSIEGSMYPHLFYCMHRAVACNAKPLQATQPGWLHKGYTLLKLWTMLLMLQVYCSDHTGAYTGQSEKYKAKQMPHAPSLFRSLLHIGTQLCGQAIVSQRHMPRDQDHVATNLMDSLALALPPAKTLSTAMPFASKLRCSWHVRCTRMTSLGLQECQKCRHSQIDSSPRQPTSSTWSFSKAKSFANTSTCDTCQLNSLNFAFSTRSRAAIKVQVGFACDEVQARHWQSLVKQLGTRIPRPMRWGREGDVGYY